MAFVLSHGTPVEEARVLNAAVDQTLERTIVEAFVKLVVCRKVTVQKVAALSGQVLDSCTTQVLINIYIKIYIYNPFSACD
jgi:hypothetical protein